MKKRKDSKYFFHRRMITSTSSKTITWMASGKGHERKLMSPRFGRDPKGQNVMLKATTPNGQNLASRRLTAKSTSKHIFNPNTSRNSMNAIVNQRLVMIETLVDIEQRCAMVPLGPVTRHRSCAARSLSILEVDS
jgi:hypothetical protein